LAPWYQEKPGVFAASFLGIPGHRQKIFEANYRPDRGIVGKTAQAAGPGARHGKGFQRLVKWLDNQARLPKS